MVTPAFLISNIPPDDSNVLVRIGSAKTTLGSKVLVTGEKSKKTYVSLSNSANPLHSSHKPTLLH